MGSERATIAERQGASENTNYEGKPTKSKTNFSSCLGTEQKYEVVLRKQKIGKYIANLVVENLIIVELKCCKILPPEHQAQVINYLKASDLPVGLLVNFGNQKLEYKRLHHPNHFLPEGKIEEPLAFLTPVPWEK